LKRLALSLLIQTQGPTKAAPAWAAVREEAVKVNKRGKR
jgi:hypothetical protein